MGSRYEIIEYLEKIDTYDQEVIISDGEKEYSATLSCYELVDIKPIDKIEKIKAETKKLKADFETKRDELIARKAAYNALKGVLNYSLEPGINLSDVRQYINDKMDEL